MSKRFRIVIPGGTGRLSLLLASHFHRQGHIVSTISRFPKPRDWEAIHWDSETLGDWASCFEAADAIINLSGRSSRLISRAISQCSYPPRVWLNTVRVSAPPIRFVELRVAPVMTPGFGAFPLLLGLVRHGFGGRIGSANQYVRWIHDLDFLRAIELLIDGEEISGAIEIAASALPNDEFMADLRDAWSQLNLALHVPSPLIRLLQPGLLSNAASSWQADLPFQFSDWHHASQDLVRRWRSSSE